MLFNSPNNNIPPYWINQNVITNYISGVKWEIIMGDGQSGMDIGQIVFGGMVIMDGLIWST